MKTKILTLLFLLLSSSILASTPTGCPWSVGETNSCDLEHAHTTAAMRGLTPFRTHKYCRAPEAGIGIQCRTLTVYKDRSGYITDSYFKLQFRALEDHRDILWDTYYVQRRGNIYNSYHDEKPDSIFMIDHQADSWVDVEVDFDGYFPTYDAQFIVAGTSQVIYATIIFSDEKVDLILNIDKPRSQQKTITYWASEGHMLDGLL